MQLSAKGADAELTKDSIVSALGYTPEKLDAGWVHIETVTISDDETAELVRTQEPDGTPYDFKGIWIYILGKQNTQWLYVFLNGSAEYLGVMNPSNTSNYWAYFKAENRGGLFENESLGNGFLGSGIKSRITPAYTSMYACGKDVINKVRVSCGDSFTFTSGTRFAIYAIRA